MKKGLRKLSMLTMVLALVFMFGTLTMAAEKTVYKLLGAGKWGIHYYNEGNKTYSYYTVKVPAAGVLTWTFKGSANIAIYKTKADIKKNNNFDYVYSGYDKKTMAVDKGTYYIKINGVSSQAKYKFTKGVFKANYSPAKAIALKANTNVGIVQTPLNHYSRWYKVTLKKNQPITFWTNTSSGNVQIFNGKMKELKIERAGSESTKYYTYEKQKKGTYYVKVTGFNSGREMGAYITLKWK